MDPLGSVHPEAAASALSPSSAHELQLQFHDTLAAGERLWVRGRVASCSNSGNGHAHKRSWWKPWRTNGHSEPPPLRLESSISGHILQAELSVQGDGNFEGLLTAPLPPARRGWRIARNRLALNGHSTQSCNVVLVAPETAVAVAIVLPIETTWMPGSVSCLGGLAHTDVSARLQFIRRSSHCQSIYYVAAVPADSEFQRPDLAITITSLRWPAGHLLLAPGERTNAAATVATALDRLRWLLGESRCLWLLNLETEFDGTLAAGTTPQTDRATVDDLNSLADFERSIPARRNAARPTRATLLPRHPVVFCHGMLGYSMLKMHRPIDINYFSALEAFLDPRGVHVLFPKVGPTSGVEERAEQLRDQIKRWTDEPVNIVAHSMGGLDARFMISHLGMADRVRSLTTIATPHRGSYMADWFQANFRQRVPLLLALEALGFNVNGFGDCRPDACREFNSRTADSPNVRYFSHGADVPPARLTPFLRRAWNLLTPVEGPNDGLVSVQSARWGEYLGTIHADHFAQTPDGVFVRDGEDFDALGFYIRLVENLARRGF